MDSTSRNTSGQQPLVHKIATGIALFVILVVAGVFRSEVIVPYFRLIGNRYDVNRVRAKWISSGPIAYQVTVWQTGFLDVPDICDTDVTGHILTVVHGKVVASNAPSQCNVMFEQITIEKSFDLIDQTLQSVNFILASRPALKYDSEYPYIYYFYVSEAETIFSSHPSEWHTKSFGYQDLKTIDVLTDSVAPIP